MGVLTIRATLVGVYIKAPAFFVKKIPLVEDSGSNTHTTYLERGGL